jgi:hypothetical protein
MNHSPKVYHFGGAQFQAVHSLNVMRAKQLLARQAVLASLLRNSTSAQPRT